METLLTGPIKDPLTFSIFLGLFLLLILGRFYFYIVDLQTKKAREELFKICARIEHDVNQRRLRKQMIPAEAHKLAHEYQIASHDVWLTFIRVGGLKALKDCQWNRARGSIPIPVY